MSAVVTGQAAAEQCESILARAAEGGRVTREEALLLYQHAELLELARSATAIRNRDNHSRSVTYLVDRNINYTNICRTSCSFCAFSYPDSKHPESYVHSREVLGEKIKEALELGATRILLQGGLNDDLPYAYYLDLIQWIHESFPIEINAFSAPEIEQMHRISGKPYEEILKELKSAGLAGLPGGGAEILDDDVRGRVSPKKTKAGEWIRIMEAAHVTGLTTTATMVIGFGESYEQRLNHLERLRALQDHSRSKDLSGFIAFISWTLQLNEKTALGRSRGLNAYRVNTIDYLRNIALARIFLDNIPHHQSSWPTMGAEIAQLSLFFGCDDFGSTMMEENVVSQAGAPNQSKWSMSPEELQNYIRDAGFAPVQRDTSYRRVSLGTSDAGC